MNGKALGLFVAIIFPLSFFLFFDHCDYYQLIGKKNRPVLPRYIPAAQTSSDSSGQAAGILKNDTLWHQVPPFSFVAQTGDTISEKTFANKIYVADFFFSHCPGICPKMSMQLQRIQREFKTDDDIRILSHTVDPARDTPARLREYADLYEVDSTKWFMVTGNKPDLYAQARKGYYVVANEGDGGEEDFIHTEKFMLVDKDRVIRGYYDGTDPKEVERLMVDIKVLKLEYPQKKRLPSIELNRERALEDRAAGRRQPH